MYHTIEFNDDFVVDLEVTGQARLERILIRKGRQLHAQIRPYVVETEEGPVEVADLYLDDGSTTRRVRWECFRFVD